MSKPKEKSKKELNEKKEREQGFNIYLQGANAERVNSQLKREKVQKYKRNESQGGGKDRKNWGQHAQPRLFSDDSTFKSQKFVAEEKKSEINRKKWGKDPEKRPNTNNSIANEIFGLNDNIEPFSNQKEELIVPEEDDASLVNCIDSLDMESVNFLRESMRLVMKKPEKIEKIPKNDEIEEILEEVPENFGAGKEENEEIQEEIYNYTIKQPEIKEKKPEFVKKNVKIIKARPISANFNSLMSRETRELKKEGSEGVFASNNQRLNTNPFSRPQTELSYRITKVKEQDTTNVSKGSPLKTKGFEHLLKKIEQMSEEKKNELEFFLQRIIEGRLDIKELLKFEFDKEEGERKSRNFRLKFPNSNKTEIMAGVRLNDSTANTRIEKNQEKNIEKMLKDSKPLQKAMLENNTILSEKANEKPIIIEKMNEKIGENKEKKKSDEKLEKLEKIVEKTNEKWMISPSNRNIIISERSSQKQAEFIPPYKNQLKLRIISTWGCAHSAGLTEIQLFGSNYEKIPVSALDLSVKNGSLNATKGLKAIVNGEYQTVEEENMWISQLPTLPECLEICILFDKHIEIGGICLWNYNRSLIDSVKGVKDIEILLNNELLWSGKVRKGVGNEFEDYREVISLKADFDFEKLRSKEIPRKTGFLAKIGNKIEPNIEKLKERPQIITKKDISLDKPIEIIEKPVISNEKPRDFTEKITNNEKILIEKSIGIPEKPLSLNEKPFSFNENNEKSNKIIEKPKFIIEKPKPAIEKPHEQKPQNLTEKPQNIIENLEKPKPNCSQEKPSIFTENPLPEKSSPTNENPFKITQKPLAFNENPVISSEKTTEKSVTSKAPLEKTLKESPFPKQARISSAKPSKNTAPGGKTGLLMPNTTEDPDPNSLEKLQYFNLTNEGRIHPETRERVLQEEAVNMQKDVQKHLKILQNNIDFNEDFDFDELDDLFRSSTQKKPVMPARKTLDSSKKFDKNTEKPERKFEINEKLNLFCPFLPDILTNTEKDPNFLIPTLPKGRYLTFRITNTWGDRYYVGLAGLELFDDNGTPIKIPKEQIKADPADINTLPGYGKDPRTIDKLIDGTYLTCDDVHMWLTPFTFGKNHWVFMDLGSARSLALIRIWNYNKSRIHSVRGVRNLAIYVDKKLVFDGEIKKASGRIGDCRERCEYIMFTEQENLIRMIEKGDWLNNLTIEPIEEERREIERPGTANKELQEIEDILNERLGEDGRPMTSVWKPANFMTRDKIEVKTKENINEKPIFSKEAKAGRCLKIEILENWGDPYYVGLTGLEIYDANGNKIFIQKHCLDCKPIRDLKSGVPGAEKDPRVLENLINNMNLTTNDKNMWLVPFNRGGKIGVSIEFQTNVSVAAIRIYNYNKNREDIFRGAKKIRIFIDNQAVTPENGIILKKASGVNIFDFGQTIEIPFKSNWDLDKIEKINLKKEKIPKVIQEYDTLPKLMGFTLKIVLLSTWGDPYYIGLNGIEIFDHEGVDLIASKSIPYSFGAEPPSVNCLKGMQNDLRTIEKLFNGKNHTFDDRNMWLSPFLCHGEENDNGVVSELKNNTIFITFDQMVLISCINFWNYVKTPKRGVKELEIYLDENLVYKGYLKKAKNDELNKDLIEENELKTSVLFNKSKDLAGKIKAALEKHCLIENPLLLYNEKKLMNEEKSLSFEPIVPLERPQTSVKGMGI